MKKILQVIRYELVTTLTRPSFLLAAVGLPLIGALIFMVVGALNRQAPGAVNAVFGLPQPAEGISEGYVDQGGIIRSIPASVPQGRLVAYPDEASAQRSLQAGAISAYYMISKDYLETGKIIYVRPDFNPLSGFDQAGTLKWVVQVNLLGGDWQRVNQINQPLNVQVTQLEPATQRDENNPLTFILPYAVTMIYYIVILMSASLLLSSVTKEKENRVMEILMSSVTPRQLLTGKIAGLGIAGLIQTVLWVGTGYGLTRVSGGGFKIPTEFQLQPSFLAWGLVFFLLGYAVYASLMAAVGALVPNLREASQATIVVIFPLLIPMMLISVLAEAPNGPLSVGFSLFPLTAPVTMMTRLSAGDVPLWQLVLAVILLLVTAILIVRAVAGLFRAQTLLSGQPFGLKRFLNALAGRG